MKSLTPKKVALAIGVSESSMKRWCDRGLIETTRTAGGHRRLVKSSVVQFLRDQQHRLVDPQMIGLPESTPDSNLSATDASERYYNYLLQSDLSSCKSLVIEQYLSGRSLGETFDEVIAPAFNKIGRKWDCGDIDEYQERRGCEICIASMKELSDLLPTPNENAPLALGGAPENDAYNLPSLMVELVLREKGWRTESLGSHIPFTAFSNAANDYQPKFVWISVSQLQNPEKFLEEYAAFVNELDPNVLIVVGGRALTADIRANMKFSAHCDTMQQLEAFVDREAPQRENTNGHAVEA